VAALIWAGWARRRVGAGRVQVQDRVWNSGFADIR
jgi:hypothetical protein